jgi:hypothetical protein
LIYSGSAAYPLLQDPHATIEPRISSYTNIGVWQKGQRTKVMPAGIPPDMSAGGGFAVNEPFISLPLSIIQPKTALTTQKQPRRRSKPRVDTTPAAPASSILSRSPVAWDGPANEDKNKTWSKIKHRWNLSMTFSLVVLAGQLDFFFMLPACLAGFAAPRRVVRCKCGGNGG